jgi:hypothetical protein
LHLGLSGTLIGLLGTLIGLLGTLLSRLSAAACFSGLLARTICVSARLELLVLGYLLVRFGSLNGILRAGGGLRARTASSDEKSGDCRPRDLDEPHLLAPFVSSWGGIRGQRRRIPTSPARAIGTAAKKER